MPVVSPATTSQEFDPELGTGANILGAYRDHQEALETVYTHASTGIHWNTFFVLVCGGDITYSAQFREEMKIRLFIALDMTAKTGIPDRMKLLPRGWLWGMK